ncbi:MAG: flavodoxin-dependent (E)-4-hydroxy-3-methylbut-2-enyl-diphosphate synthase [Butyrivibrio sp.]|nr:flavodoxin-dependent (E)-4-hydroxy-3-methylbut-2-enyl-diphosphate synthase [Butyrivibrio sp.]
MTDKTMHRAHTKQVRIGDLTIGGGTPIRIQSMTNTPTEDVAATVAQILALEEAGCEIVRCTVPTQEAAEALGRIKKQVHIPVVADIHFDYRMALAAMENGADKIRINPGNIGGEDRVRSVVTAAKEREIPIRVGVNSGSLEREIVERDGGVTAAGIVESALDKVRMIEACDYDRIVISIKSSDVPLCIEAHELLAKRTDYPIHIGITEAGTLYGGTIKSAVGLGILLYLGIGDTLRVSLSGDPVEEIRAARQILRDLHLRRDGIEVVSCPTCGRTKIDLVTLAAQVEELVQHYDYDIRVAVMGCAVNGPGEAREADLGVAGGDGEGLLFRHGEILRKLPESELLQALKDELDHWGEGT